MSEEDLKKYQGVITSLVEDVLKVLPPDTEADFIKGRPEIIMAELRKSVQLTGLRLSPAIAVLWEDVEEVVHKAYCTLIEVLEKK